ncbi:MarR family winged helix-turn-helix transcriptional regulator [Nocardiopsis coralliicola]
MAESGAEQAGPGGALADETGFRLIKLGELVHAAGERALEPVGISPRLFNVLATAAAMDSPSQQDLASALGFDPNVMVGVVDELESLGLAARQRNPRDRRRYIVAPTEAGLLRIEEAGRAIAAAQDALFAVLPDEDRAALHRASGLLLAAHPRVTKKH